MINTFKTLLNGLIEYVKNMKSDWNENDPSSPHYIKNRTHWKENKRITIMKEQTVLFNDGFSALGAIPVIGGKKYTIVFDGVEYECLCSSEMMIGNSAIMPGYDEDTGEPFLLSPSPDGFVCETIGSDNSSHTIGIFEQITVYHPLDIDYIPALEEATDTTKGLCPPLTQLCSGFLEAAESEYHTEKNIQVTGYTDAKDALPKSISRNLPIGIFNSSKKMSGKILSGYDNAVSSKVTVVISGYDKISCLAISDSAFEKMWEISAEGITIKSSTEDSTKNFRITVDDTGTLSATEVTS